MKGRRPKQKTEVSKPHGQAQAKSRNEAKEKLDDALKAFQRYALSQLGIRKSWEELEAQIASLKAKSANGDRGALQVLYNLANESADALQALEKSNLTLVKAFAETKIVWPVSLHPAPKPIRETVARLKQLGLGSKASVMDLNAVFKDPSNQTAIRGVVENALIMIEIIRRAPAIIWYEDPVGSGSGGLGSKMELPPPLCDDPEFEKRCVALPKLTTKKSDLGLWFEVVKKAILLGTSEHPEDVPDLRKIGIYRQFHASSLRSGGSSVLAEIVNADASCSMPDHPASDELSPGSVEANIRGAIWKAVRRCLESLAPEPDAVGS